MELAAKHKLYIELQNKIEEAIKNNQQIDNFVKKQIELMETVYNEFVSDTLNKNKKAELNMVFTEIRIKQLQAITSLCKKIGISSEKYDNEIRNIREKNLGVDIVNERYKSIAVLK